MKRRSPIGKGWTLVAAAFVLILFAGTGAILLVRTHPSPARGSHVTPTPLATTSTSSTATRPIEASVTISNRDRKVESPVLLEIPAIGVRAQAEKVAKGARGIPGTPSNPDHVGACEIPCSAPLGWPGDTLIVGHYDRMDGSKAVFYELGQLKTGSDIWVTTASGTRFHYVVVQTRQDPVANGSFDLAPSGPSRLVLETCAGQWDQRAGTYTLRTMVTANLAT